MPSPVTKRILRSSASITLVSQRIVPGPIGQHIVTLATPIWTVIYTLSVSPVTGSFATVVLAAADTARYEAQYSVKAQPSAGGMSRKRAAPYLKR